MRVEFFFSPASRYSYLASTQIRVLESEARCSVVWRPVHGPDIRRLRGRDPFSGPALSGQYEPSYRRADAEAWAEQYGVPFQEPREFHFDYALLVRAALAGQNLGGGAEFLLGLGTAVFGSGRWPIDEALLIEVAEAHGLEPARFTNELRSGAVAEAMAHAAREAFERGAFGVPTFFAEKRMFWGNDRIPLLRHYLKTHAAQQGAPADEPQRV